jgi:hypothetical protein
MPNVVVPPQGYPSPKHLVWGAHDSIIYSYGASHKGGKVSPEATADELWHYATSTEATSLWANHMGPVFFLDKNLAEMLSQTTPPQGVTWEELEVPFPTFGLILPETYKRPLLLVSCTKNEAPKWSPKNRELLEKIKLVYIGENVPLKLWDIYNPVKDEGPWPEGVEHYLRILPGSTKEFLLPSMTKTGRAGGDLNYILNDFAEYTGSDPDSGLWNNRLVMNLLCWLKYEHAPETKGTKKWEETMALPSPEPALAKRGFKTPVMLKDVEPEYPERIGGESKTDNESQTHASPVTHWRRGHWHSVLYGPGKTMIRRQWFRPTLVNPES